MDKDEILDVIRRKLVGLLPDLDPARVVPEQSMKDLGANSIDRADVIIETMEELEIKVRLSELGSLKNLGELVDFLHERKGAGTA